MTGRITDTLNPWCCRLSRAEAKFQQQCLAVVPTASLHVRAALLLRLNDRIEVTMWSKIPSLLVLRTINTSYRVLPTYGPMTPCC